MHCLLRKSFAKKTETLATLGIVPLLLLLDRQLGSGSYVILNYPSTSIKHILLFVAVARNSSSK